MLDRTNVDKAGGSGATSGGRRGLAFTVDPVRLRARKTVNTAIARRNGKRRAGISLSNSLSGGIFATTVGERLGWTWRFGGFSSESLF